MAEINFRFYREGDEKGIVDAINSSFKSFREWGLKPETWLNYEQDDYAFKRNMALVAELNGRIIGHLHLILRRLKMGEKVFIKTGGIANVTTHPDYRGRGIATSLMKKALDFCKKNNIPLSGLFTGYPGTAHRIYRRVGYANTFFTYTLVSEIEEILEDVEKHAPSPTLEVKEISIDELDTIARLYELAHERYLGVAWRPPEYWMRKVLGEDKGYYQSFFYDKADRFLRLKALRKGSPIGYLIGFIPKDSQSTFLPKDSGIILELVSLHPAAAWSLLTEAVKEFNKKGLRVIRANIPLEEEYADVLKGLQIFRCGGIFMEAVPRLDLLFKELEGEFSSRIEEAGLNMDQKILLRTRGGRCLFKVKGNMVEVEEKDSPDIVLDVKWDEFTRMIYGIEGFWDLYIEGNAIVSGKFSHESLKLLSVMFPPMKFHIWSIDHW